MKVVWKTFWMLVLLILLVTLVVPIGYLAWRADQPMALPQFKGYTYYQYLTWRKDALHQKTVAYLAAYPRTKIGGGLDMCYYTEIGTTLLGLPLTGFYTLAGAFPKLKNYVTPQDRENVPKDVTVWNFLPDWWLTYEKTAWYMADSNSESPVSYCRLTATPPALDP